HWFQYYDEPRYGRFDGEDFNMGLVDIDNRPYKEFCDAVKETHAIAYQIHGLPGSKPLELSERGVPLADIPRAPENPEAGLRWWPKERGPIKSEQPLAAGDLYACWRSKKLCLAVHTADYVDENLYAGGKISDRDRLEWTVEIGPNKQPLRIRF